MEKTFSQSSEGLFFWLYSNGDENILVKCDDNY